MDNSADKFVFSNLTIGYEIQVTIEVQKLSIVFELN